ncbi:MAG TPA: DMT family transporter [Candidatus Limnocylindria bacterium]|nr:DMT family transporter [Candidatus Limnocylindria bacterium]
MTATRRAPSGEALGAALVVISATCFATLGPVARFAEQAGVDALPLVTWRAAVGAAGLTLAILLGALVSGRGIRRWGQIPGRDRWWVAGAAAANAMVNLAMFIAFLRIGIGLALLIFYLYPALLAAISVTWFGERLDRTRWAALGIAMLGMLLVIGGAGIAGEMDALGIGLALVAGVGQMVYALSARHGFAAIPGPEAGALTMGGAAVIYLGISAVTGGLPALAMPLGSVHAAWPVLVAGVIGAGVPTACFIGGIRLLGPSRAAILSMLEPVVGTALAAILLSEQPGALQLAGGALIIGAGVLLQRRPRVPVAEHEAVAGA